MFAVCLCVCVKPRPHVFVCTEKGLGWGRGGSFNQEIHSTFLTPLLFSAPPSSVGLCGNRSAKLPWSSQTKTSCWLLNCFACMLIGQKSLQCIWVCACICVCDFHECMTPYCICVRTVCVSVCVGWPGPVKRFCGYLFLLVNCEADSIKGLGQFKWALSQINSVIVCVPVPRTLSPRRSPGSPRSSAERRGSDLIFRQLYSVIEIIYFFPPIPNYWIADKIPPQISFVFNLSCLFLINAGF